MTIKILYSPVFSENTSSYKMSESILQQTINGKTTYYNISDLTQNYYYSSDASVQVNIKDDEIKFTLLNYISKDATEEEKFPQAFEAELEEIELSDDDEIVDLLTYEIEENDYISETDKLKAQIAVLESQLAFQSDVIQELAIQIYS